MPKDFAKLLADEQGQIVCVLAYDDDPLNDIGSINGWTIYVLTADDDSGKLIQIVTHFGDDIEAAREQMDQFSDTNKTRAFIEATGILMDDTNALGEVDA